MKGEAEGTSRRMTTANVIAEDPSARTRSVWTWLGILTILLIAFALRAYRIDGQSLWYDEGVSVAMAPRDLLAIAVDAAADIHPPLYYYLLHFWTAVFGTSEFAVRWLSLTFGVALVATVFKIGQRLLGDRIGLTAAFFTAISTLLIYYSQETRMYMQVAFFGGLSTYLFLRVQPEFGPSTARVEVGPARPQGEHKVRPYGGLRDGYGGAHWTPQGEPCVRPYLHKVIDECGRSSGGGAGLWAAYIVASAALLYSHYFAFAILVLQNLWVGISALLLLVGGRGLAIKQLAKWVGVQIMIVATFVPWLVISFGQIGGWPGISEQFDFPTLLRKVFLVFTFGLSWDAAATPRKEEFFLLLIAVAIALPLVLRTRRKVGGIAFAILYFLVPVAIMYLLSLRKPMYNPKFLLLATPGYYVLLAAGLVGVGQFAASAVRRIGRPLPVVLPIAVGGLVIGVMLVGTVFSTGKSTAAYYFDPKYARDDYRGVARFIEANSEPGDAVILNAPGQVEIFGYYFKDKEPVFPLPGERPINKQNTEKALKDITGRNKRVWLVLWAQNESDPDGFIERWLDENSFKASNVWFGGIRLALYSTAQNAARGQSFEPDVNFGNKIRLTGARVGSTMTRPGDVVEVTLDWQAIEPIDERYTVFVHIVDGHDYLWGQRDSEPGGGNKITNSWRVGETVEDRHGVAVWPGTPPGKYQIEVGLYQPSTGQRLPVIDKTGSAIADRALFGEIGVSRPTSAARLAGLAFRHPSAAVFGGNLRLLGFDFHRLGQAPTDTDFTSADYALLTFYWQAESRPEKNYLVSIDVLNQGGKIVLERTIGPVEGGYPTSQWENGEIVRDQHKLALKDFAPGEYVLRLRILDAATRAAVPISGAKALPDGSLELSTFHVR